MKFSSEWLHLLKEAAASNARPGDITVDISSNVRYNYTWNVDGVCQECGISIHAMQSPVFSIGPKSQVKWSLILYFAHDTTIQNTSASLFLLCDNSNESDVRAKFSFRTTHPRVSSITSPEMEEYCVFKHGPQSSSYGYERFIPNLCRYNTSFKICCEIEVDRSAEELPKIPDYELQDDMAAVFTAGKHTDFTITSGGVSFRVHKAILSARCPGLAPIFEHNTKEQQENLVDIKDTTPEALKEMLRFIYTGKVEGNETVARDLLAAADKYALHRLKAMCEETLCGILTVENAANILICADLHGADQLKMQTFDFIDCHTLDVMDTSDFKSMITSHPHLTAEILRAVVTFRIPDEDS